MLIKNIIIFKSADQSIQEEILLEIKECLIIAGKHNGFIFGDFVKNVLVPREKDPYCQVDFTSVNILFYKKVSSLFVTDMGKRLVPTDCENIYHLVRFGVILTTINIKEDTGSADVIYDIDSMFYIFDCNGSTIFLYIDDDIVDRNPVWVLKNKVHQKIVTIYPQRQDRILNSGAELHRLRYEFLEKGWTVCYNDKQIHLEPCTGDSTWFRKHLEILFN